MSAIETSNVSDLHFMPRLCLLPTDHKDSLFEGISEKETVTAQLIYKECPNKSKPGGELSYFS